MQYRIMVCDSSGHGPAYKIQIKRWYWPFWTDVEGCNEGGGSGLLVWPGLGSALSYAERTFNPKQPIWKEVKRYDI